MNVPKLEFGNNAEFDLDDKTGLRVVDASFQRETKFAWSLFDGYDSIRILTYSAGIGAIVRLLDKHEFETFECVFGCETTLNSLKDILAFQKVAVGDTRAAIKNLADPRHAFILERVRSGQAAFRVLRKRIAHSKLYLLENRESGDTRAIVGSANLSETAFGGRQSETLVKFDCDPEAWAHYSNQYREVRDNASDQIELPPERVETAEIKLHEIPVLNPTNPSILVIDGNTGGDSANGRPAFHVNVPTQAERIEKVKLDVIPPSISPIIPPFREGVQRVTPDALRKIARESVRIKEVRSEEEADHRRFSIDIGAKTALLLDKPYSLSFDEAKAREDARSLVDYFGNYEDAFEGGLGVERLQRDYFILWSWLYFSPFMCDMRNMAGHSGDIFRYPSFAIVYGKPSCGKSSLIDTLVTSMFGKRYSIDKRDFTKSKLRGIQSAFKRFPAIFDDIGKAAIRNHGSEIIKDENPPPATEYPCFALSMNQELNAFPDELVKRSLMVYTTTALPSYKEDRRHELHMEIQRVRRSLSDNFYREYLSRAIDALALLRENGNPLVGDWLEFSSTILSGMIDAKTEGEPPKWSAPATWKEYADKRHDRVKTQLENLLRPARRIKKEGEREEGWILESDKVIVMERTDTFGRREFDWENVPSTLIDENISVGSRTVLNRRELEEFLGARLSEGGVSRWVGKLFRLGG